MKPLLVLTGLLVSTSASIAQSASTETNAAVRAAQTASTNSGSGCIKVNMFFGGGTKDPVARKVMVQKTGVPGYDPDQVLSLEELRDRAVKAIQREGHPIDAQYMCVANIAMVPAGCTLLLHKNLSPHYQVSFDSNGLITVVSGGTGSHGEGFWKREFRNGQVGSADRSQPSSSVTNRVSGAAGSGR